MRTPFESALAARVADMADACTRCGKCYEVCPITQPAGIVANGGEIIGGIIDILGGGEGTEPARRWADSCVMSGHCIQTCDYGVNPRFLLSMARAAMTRGKRSHSERRRAGVEGFRRMSHGANLLPRMQLNDEMLERLGQRTRRPGTAAAPAKAVDFVFYTGCNVLKTPHIALLALDIMDALGITYTVMGGTTHCCGIMQGRAADTEAMGSLATNTIEKLAAAKTGKVLSWCPSCHVQISETTLPAYERATGSRPFELTPFMLFLRTHLDALRARMTHRVGMRVAMHWHPGLAGVVRATREILASVEGLEIVDLGLPAVGLMSNYLNTMPQYKRTLYRQELDAARDAGVDALVAVYHADHRELCAHERELPLRIINVLEIVGASMGLRQADTYKPLKMLQDVERIIAECADLIAAHDISA
ncbi:MAG: (Fe-S)-binding protein, partial [Proteobacteria bacterium]|nr:(Fe-S)-binding protein [Pseudomonadota bacterium]